MGFPVASTNHSSQSGFAPISIHTRGSWLRGPRLGPRGVGMPGMFMISEVQVLYGIGDRNR